MAPFLRAGTSNVSRRPRLAWAQSRTFERYAPTTPQRDPPARMHHPAVHIAPAQPASPHWPISTVARCGEGALVGGWHAGASPSTPIMRWVVNRWSSSASFARPYTPLGRSRGPLWHGWLMTKFELEIESSGRVFFLEFVEYINLTVSHSGARLHRTPPQTFTQPYAVACAASPPCPHQWGANLTIPACPCAQEACSTSLLTIPNGRLCRWLLQVRPAARCARLGPRKPASSHHCAPPQARAQFL